MIKTLSQAKMNVKKERENKKEKKKKERKKNRMWINSLKPDVIT